MKDGVISKIKRIIINTMVFLSGVFTAALVIRGAQLLSEELPAALVIGAPIVFVVCAIMWRQSQQAS